MKKIFTLMAAFAATIAMQAANFQLYFGDTPCTDGATYTSYTYLSDEEEYKGVVYKTWLQDANLFFHAPVGTNLTVEVVADYPVAVCSLDGFCAMATPNETMTKKGSLTREIESAEIHNEVETEDDEDPTPLLNDITVKVTVYESSKPEDKISVTVLLSKQTAGINNAVAEKTFIKAAAGNTLQYNVAKPTTLQVYAITGNLVAKYRISNAGSLNVSNLGKGMFIYTDGVHKGKLIVR